MPGTMSWMKDVQALQSLPLARSPGVILTRRNASSIARRQRASQMFSWALTTPTTPTIPAVVMKNHGKEEKKVTVL